jgi:hypothetical protein
VLEAKDGVAVKTARVYQLAKATIADQTRRLRPERSFMVAHRLKDQLIIYSPKGPLVGEEMELTEHFDTLALPGLLPGKEVKIGDTWSLPPAIIQALCGLDALDASTKQDLGGALKSVQGDRARVTLQGTVRGIHLGAQVSIHVAAKSFLVFDIKEKRIVELEWHQSDQRQQGPATPHLSADVVIKLERTPIPQPAELNDLALVPVPNGAPPAGLTNIVHRDPQRKFEFQHSREWQYVGERNGQKVWKLVTARGDYIADAILAPWKGRMVPDAQVFKQLMEESPGWKQESDTQLDDAVKHPAGYTVYRASAAGKMEGSPAFRSAYLLANPAGQQFLVTFITPPNQVSNLETRDQALVESIELK